MRETKNLATSRGGLLKVRQSQNSSPASKAVPSSNTMRNSSIGDMAEAESRKMIHTTIATLVQKLTLCFLQSKRAEAANRATPHPIDDMEVPRSTSIVTVGMGNIQSSQNRANPSRAMGTTEGISISRVVVRPIIMVAVTMVHMATPTKENMVVAVGGSLLLAGITVTKGVSMGIMVTSGASTMHRQRQISHCQDSTGLVNLF